MTLQLREKLRTTVRSILPTTDKLLEFFSYAGKLTLVSSVLLQPIIQSTTIAQEKTTIRRTSSKLRRFETTDTAKSRQASEWRMQKSLANSNDQLSWKRPLHTGLESIHNKQPSFIAPPKSMKRAELPAELSHPGDVVKAVYVEPTSGNAVVTATGTTKKGKAGRSKNNSEDRSRSATSRVEQAAYDEITPLPLTPARGAGASDSTTRRDEIRVSQNDVFGDQDFDGLPEEFEDTEAFGDNELTTEGELDDGFNSTDTDGIDATVDDGFGPIDDGLPDPTNDDPALNEPPSDGSLTGDPSFDDADAPTTDNGVEELPSVPENEGLTDDDVGPVRRPEMNGSEFDGTGGTSDGADPVDLSVFNGRNCPADLEVYEAAKTAFLNRPITAISLDITPEIEPNVSAEEMAKRRDERLRGAPEREWRNRKGEVVATGYMRDFKNGRVHIESDSGETKEVDFYRLSSSDMCMVSAWWGIPTESQVEIGKYEVRNWTTQTFTWKASGLCHKPLYFEEVQLERYGHSAGPMKQTISSGVHFFGNLLFLPYKMGVHPPNECQYALGYYRPGDCAPWLLHAMPLSARGARWQTAAMLGGIWLVP